MYTQFYGLNEKPFALVPDPRFLYLGRSHGEALAHLMYGVQEGEGFVLIVGQVGTGKTTLCRTLLDQIGSDTELCFIFNPSSTEVELLASINREFGLPTAVRTRSELVEELNRFLVRKKSEGRRILLVIDEAQNLDPEVLEQIRLLSNLETEREKLLQIILLGQLELDETLSRPELRQLRQRIAVRWKLEPFKRSETAAYVEHRLKVSGASDPQLFTLPALALLHHRSGGIPRLINSIADRALLAGFSAGKKRIGARLVRGAAREVIDSEPPILRRLSLSPGSATLLALLGFAVGLALVGFSALPDGLSPLARVAAPGEVPSAVEGGAPYEVAAGPRLPALDPDSVDYALLAHEAPVTAARALDALLDVWGYPPLRAERLSPNAFAGAVREVSPMRVFATRATREQLVHVNLPVILELEPGSDERRYATLIRVDPTGAALLSVGGRAYSVEPVDLERLWTGRAFFVWSNFESVPTLSPGMNGTAVRWLQARLTELDYLRPGDPTGEFDARTTEAIRRFQSNHRLEPTGEVGPTTLIALYQALRYGAPRLAALEDA
jgi:general secretion pathway protein A